MGKYARASFYMLLYGVMAIFSRQRAVPCLCTPDTNSLSVNSLMSWTEVLLALTTENLDFNITNSWKADQRASADRLEGYCYVWPQRVEPSALSGCVVVSPSATMWGAPGAVTEAALPTETSRGAESGTELAF